MDNDLTSAVRTAGRGLRRDVKVLCEALSTGHLLMPLAAPAPEVATGPLDVSIHVAPDGHGRPFGMLFTRPDFLAHAGAAYGWKTAGEPLQYMATTADAALDLMIQMLDREGIWGVVINVGQPDFLDLTPIELRSLSRREALPIMRRIASVPVQKDEQFLVGQPSTPPSPALIAVLDAFVARHPEITSYRIAQTYNADRDVAPHLTVVFRTKSGRPREDALAQDLGERLRGVLKENEYVDFLYNVDLGGAAKVG